MHTKYEQKVVGNWFCMPIIFKNLLKTELSIIKKYTYYNLCRWCLNCNEIFLFEKIRLLMHCERLSVYKKI